MVLKHRACCYATPKIASSTPLSKTSFSWRAVFQQTSLSQPPPPHVNYRFPSYPDLHTRRKFFPSDPPRNLIMDTVMNSCSMTTVPKCAITPRAGVVAPRLPSRSLKASPAVARPASILTSKRIAVSVRTAAAAPVAEEVSQVGHTPGHALGGLQGWGTRGESGVTRGNEEPTLSVGEIHSLILVATANMPLPISVSGTKFRSMRNNLRHSYY